MGGSISAEVLQEGEEPRLKQFLANWYAFRASRGEGDREMMLGFRRLLRARELVVPDCRLRHDSPFGALALQFARSSSFLVALDLSGTLLGAGGGVIVAEALERRTLKSLKLARTGLVDRQLWASDPAGACLGFRAIVAELHTNLGLHTLDLAGNGVCAHLPGGGGGGGGLQRDLAELRLLTAALMCNGTLTDLDLSDNSLGPEGAAALADGIRSPHGYVDLAGGLACEGVGRGCDQPPFWGYPEGKPGAAGGGCGYPRWCSAHKPHWSTGETLVDHHEARCRWVGGVCTTRPAFGDRKDNVALYCREHRVSSDV